MEVNEYEGVVEWQRDRIGSMLLAPKNAVRDFIHSSSLPYLSVQEKRRLLQLSAAYITLQFRPHCP